VIDTSPYNLWREINGAEKHRDHRIKKLGEITKAYHGPAYDPGGSKYDSENFAYELVSWMVPQMVFNNPKVRAKSRRGDKQQDVAEALGRGLNRWVKDVEFRKTLLPLAVDTMLSWGTALVTMEDNERVRDIPAPSARLDRGQWQAMESEKDPQEQAQPMWPVVTRIPPHRYFRDPAALQPDESRFEGHTWIRDKEDLLLLAEEDSTWIKDNIIHLATPEDVDDQTRKGKEIPERGEVLAYEVWIPEVELDSFPDDTEGAPSTDEGFHGTIYTIAVRPAGSGNQEAVDYIRQPRPFFGPRWGPYCTFGVHSVPDDPYPLSPVMAVKPQADELNRMGTALTRSAERYKRVFPYDAKDSATAKALREAEHDVWLPIQGFDPDKFLASSIEVGGLTDQILAHRNDRRALLDRVSGFTDMQRGAVTGGVTATESTLADSNSSIRTGFIKQQFQDGALAILRTVAWYMYHEDSVVFPLAPEDVADMGFEPGLDLWYRGGEHESESGYTFDDLEVEIEAYSMERTDEGLRQRRMAEGMTVLASFFPWMAQVPNGPWKELWGLYGDVMNQPEFADLGRMFADSMAQMGGMPMAAPAQPQTRLSGDVGGAGTPKPPMPKTPSGMPGNNSVGNLAGGN
jgi:hypothetical protein